MLLSVLALSCTVALPARSQTPPAPAAADYSKEAAVGDFVSTKISFENDGTATTELTLRARVQSDAGVKHYGLETFSYQGATQTIEIAYIRVRKPDGSVVNTPLDNIQDLDAGITRDAPFYSDLREKHAAVKGLSPGDTLEYQVRWHTTKPLAPGQFWYNFDFEHEAIVLDEELEISIPRNRPVKLKSPDYKFAVADSKDRRVYTWKTANLKDHSQESSESKGRDARLGQLPPADVQISSFQSWDEVGRWYWGLQRERAQPTADIRTKYTELAQGTTDSSAILHTLYDFVSLKFRYIGVAFGIGRYQPHAAEDVLSNQFGDCKDKHTLLASLASAGGITVYPALISSSRRLDPDVPSPSQFDHVITAVPKGNGFDWLDTTAEVGPFGYLVPNLRDKQALVMPGDKPAVLVSTPAELPFQGVQKLSVEGKLSPDGTLDAKMKYSAHGDFEVLLRAGFRQVAQPQWKDFVQQLSYGMGFAGTVSDVNATSPEDTRSPFEFSYSYDRKDYPDWSNHRITMPGMRLSVPAVKDDDAGSKTPIWLGSSIDLISDTKVEVPAGYSPDLPSDVVILRDYAEYRSTYRQEGQTIVSHRELKSKMREVPEASRQDYKDFAKNLDEDINRYIVLNSAASPLVSMLRDPSTLSLAEALRTLPSSSNAEAQKFEKQAFKSMVNNQDAAVEDLKKAVAADPKFARAWVILGSLQMTLAHSDAGLSAFRSAIDSDPTQPVPYQMLASALVNLRRVDEAIEVWRSLLKASPDDPVGVRNLAELLYVDKRYADAVPLLESEVNLDPSAAEPKSRLGIAYLNSGAADKGYALLQELLKANSGTMTLNAVAYELADANVKLPEALDYAQKAVNAEEEASQKIHLPEVALDDFQSASRIASYWDTLGWVHFRLGRLEDAEQYLHSAWTLSQNGVIAGHLGQLYEAKQRKTDAIHMYRLALRASTSSLSGGDEARIKARLTHLDPSADVSGLKLRNSDSIGNELSEMRSVKLARFYQGSASADFDLLFGPDGKVEEVKRIKGSEKLDDAEKALRSARFPFTFPEGSKAHVLRQGILSCSTYTGCSIVLLTPEMVTTVN